MRQPTARSRSVLGLLGACVVAACLWLARIPNVVARPSAFLLWLLVMLALCGLATLWVAWYSSGRWALGIIVAVALAARITFAFQAPTASSDIYRYVWDGRVQSAGINPYRYPPDSPALAPLRDEAIYPNINRRAVPTIYPPVAQGVFRALYALHPDSVTWTKLAFAALDLVTIALLANLLARLGRKPQLVVLYAWHPLAIFEVGHGGHVDVVAASLLILAVRARLDRRAARVGALLAAAALVKFYVLVALPALLLGRLRRDLRLGAALIAVAALAYLPFISVGTKVLGYLPGYVQEEGISSGTRYALPQLIARAGLTWPKWLPSAGLGSADRYLAFMLGTMALVGLCCWLRRDVAASAVPNRALLLILAFLVLTTPEYPWYALMAAAVLPLASGSLLLPGSVVTGTASLLYLQWWWPGNPAWPVDLTYLSGAVTLTMALVAPAACRLAVSSCRGALHAPASHDEPAANRRHQSEAPSLFECFPWLYAFCRERLFRDDTERIIDALWPEGEPEAACRVLELGCGPGFYTCRLARRFPGIQAIGVDRAAPLLERARQRAECRGLTNCRFRQADVEVLPWQDGAVDAAIASRLFIMLPEPEQALAEIHRVLGPGGRLFVAEPRPALLTTLPLHALWFAARLRRLTGDRTAYREPSNVLALDAPSFRRVIASCPWDVATIGHNRRYHYAVCQKRAVAPARERAQPRPHVAPLELSR